MDSGKYGNIESMDQWRYGELKNLGITFSQNEAFANFPKSNNINRCKMLPSFYKGIFLTGSWRKKEVIKDIFLPNDHIVFIDDRKYQIEDVYNVCRESSIGFTGILFTGSKLIKGKLDDDIAKIQKFYLVERGVWLEDDEAYDILKLHGNYNR
jgi:hypothetical protein